MHPLFDPGQWAGFAAQWAATLGPLTIKASLLLAMTGLLSLALCRASASTRHLMWTTGVVYVVMLPLLTAALPTWRTVAWPSALNFLEPARAETAPATPLQSLERARRFDRMRDQARVQPRNLSPGIQGSPSQPSHALQPQQNTATSWLYLLEKLSQWPAVVWLFVLWQTGALLLLGVLFAGVLRLSWLRVKATPLHEDGWGNLLLLLSGKLGIRLPVTLLRSDRAVTPMTWGLRRPVIMLPHSCDEWTEEQRREVLVHELAHIKRRDCLTQSLAQIACIAYWFNPLVWLAARRMRIERERACDDRVLLAGAKPSSYAGHLLQIACSLGAESRATGLSVAMARRSQMSGRLMALLDPRQRRFAPGRFVVLAITTLTLLITLPLAAITPAGDENASTTGITSVTTSRATFDGSSNWVWSDDDYSLEVKMKGKIEFTEGETDIAWMSQRAHFEIKENDDGEKRRLKVEPGKDGKPAYQYYEGRREQPFDDEARTWFAEVMEKAVRHMGFAIEGRVRRIYEQEGLDGLMQEIAEIESDHAKAQYYSHALALEKLQAEQAARLMEQAASQMDSDFEKARLLTESQKKHALLANERARRAYLAMAGSITSDFERGRTLQTALKSGDLAPEDVTLLLMAAKDMDSDFELGNVLTAIETDQLADTALREAYFKAVDSMDSDFEKGRVLSHVLAGRNVQAETVTAALAALQDMDSDFESAKILVQSAAHYSDDERYREHYFAAIDDMDSDFECSRALTSILTRDDLSGACVKRALQSAAELDSDFEKAKVLVSAAPHCATSDELEEAFEEAADTIDSTHEYGRAMKALREERKSI